ncbi:hypothetical protein GCM10025857_15590 [Alicyclobacillus contaminans]|nr:hypothetical protein GCM10025857_15590 [Alicyclobacillus contaminans]
MALYEFRFPELGEGLHEGRIEKWLVQPGDTVKEDDAIAEVENDKAMVELPSPVDGKVVKIHLEAGGTATVGDVIITFEVEGEGNVSGDAVAAATAPTEEAKPANTPAAPAPAAAAPAPAAANAAAVSHAHEVLATPGVRKFARENGVDITKVHGTGTNGKITRADVEAYLSGGAAASTAGTDAAATDSTLSAAPATVASVTGEEVEERVPLSGIRKIIAQAMAKSMYTAPHVTVMDEANVTELVKLRAEVKPLAAERGVKITYLPFIVKAMVAALRDFPCSTVRSMKSGRSWCTNGISISASPPIRNEAWWYRSFATQTERTCGPLPPKSTIWRHAPGPTSCCRMKCEAAPSPSPTSALQAECFSRPSSIIRKLPFWVWVELRKSQLSKTAKSFRHT